MPEQEPLLSLGLNQSATLKSSALPDADTLQFDKAETGGDAGALSETCRACKQSFSGRYYWVNGAKVCSPCGLAIEELQRAPKPHLFLKALVWGSGAALAGTILDSTVTIITGFQFALIAILIGFMVGKAIRAACKGRGGRPQQIMAVILTYISITASYLPIAIHHQMVNGPTKTAVGTDASAANSNNGNDTATAPYQKKSGPGLLMLIIMLLGVVVAAPFLSLTSLGGLLSLLIMFWGLQRAWLISGQAQLVIVGPQGDSV